MLIMMEKLNYEKIRNILADAGIEDADFEATQLILHFCPSVTAASLPFSKKKELICPELSAAVQKRCERYPLQYIIGTWDFCGEKYRVSPDCLIPRPETELLVETAARLLPENAEFLDLCTGSGCIAISTLARRRDTTAVAVDLFENTLELARKNAEMNGVAARVTFKKHDVLLPPADEKLYDALLSNPPYIKSKDMRSLDPELYFEPRAALDGGDDGLVFYKAIIKNFRDRIKPDGFILFEAGYDTASAVAELGRLAGFSGEVIRDLSGIDRMVLLRHII
ncbi:MAG: peptide chain release factor N(5)-glutamine methyltransferase [Ruminococcaceae bacterium]|nr:peptide chain release factor N(5)-glutamine methyltransferase [Oscillospiraceae bacterium]